MQLILNNPFRILGTLSNAKATEIDRNYRKLSAFLSAGNEIEFDYDFKCLGELTRTEDDAKNAKSKINLNQDKVLAALFWFFNGSNTDEPAFDALKEGDSISAYGIWEKISSSGEVTKRNYSAFINLSTLFLNNSINGGSVDKTMLADALNLKLKFLESEYLKDFTVSVADETYKPSKEELQKKFIDEVYAVLASSNKIKSVDFIKLLNKLNFLTKQSILKNFIQIPIDAIEKKIDSSKNSRKQQFSHATRLGLKLHKDTKSDLLLLKSILGASDLNYTRIADKLADEILQSGIDYFQKYKDSEQDPGAEAMEVLQLAKSVAVGRIIQDRCNTNIENLQEWIDDKPDREAQSKVLSDVEKLKNIIEEYADKEPSVSTAKHLLILSKHPLQNIKANLGASNDLYLSISNRIASDALQMCLTTYFDLKKNFDESNDRSVKLATIMLLKSEIKPVYEVFIQISEMAMKPDFKSEFDKFYTFIKNEKKQLDEVNLGASSHSRSNSGSSGRTSSSSSSNSGCYIATMVYGNYDHPQVIVLRQFRDEVLSNYSLGRRFVSFYYKHSPVLVQKLKNKNLINKAIKFSLDSFIKLLKQR